MRVFSNLWLLTFSCSACNQLVGIDDPPIDNRVPAISGDYLLGADFRANASLGAVVRFDASLTYDRQQRIATVLIRPLSQSTHDAIGEPVIAMITISEGDNITFAGMLAPVGIPSDADTQALQFSFKGTMAGVIKDENLFCGVITGPFWTSDPANSMPLPSITFAARKNTSPLVAVQVDCNGDLAP